MARVQNDVITNTLTMDTTKAIEMSRLATEATLTTALMEKAMETAAILVNVSVRK